MAFNSTFERGAVPVQAVAFWKIKVLGKSFLKPEGEREKLRKYYGDPIIFLNFPLIFYGIYYWV